MKINFLLFIVLFFCLQAKAQVPGLDTGSCMYYPISFEPYIDTVYTFCDSPPTANFNVIIEPGPDNIWQKGKTIKFGNADIRDTSCAIITDTVNTYPINNYSAFHFLLPETPQSLFSYYLKFWHKFETDSLLDGCWLEFSSDSGVNWHPADTFFTYSFPNIYTYCNLYGKNSGGVPTPFDTLQDGRKAWSGNSNGWQLTTLHLNFAMPFKPGRGYHINAVRFVFQSDSINNNKPGWIINNFSTGWADIYIWGATSDLIAYNQLPVYPNPSSGMFNISFPDNYVKGTIHVYNIYGQKIIEKPLSPTLDLSNFNTGIYYYKASFDGKNYSGVLKKN